jgi:hypothetical protein
MGRGVALSGCLARQPAAEWSDSDNDPAVSARLRRRRDLDSSGRMNPSRFPFPTHPLDVVLGVRVMHRNRNLKPRQHLDGHLSHVPVHRAIPDAHVDPAIPKPPNVNVDFRIVHLLQLGFEIDPYLNFLIPENIFYTVSVRHVTVSMRGKDNEVHTTHVDATSLFDAAAIFIQDFHRLWWWSNGSPIKIHSDDELWMVNQETIRAWKEQKRKIKSSTA